MIDPRPAAEIARHAECQRFVRQVIQQYNRQGEAAVSRPGKGRRNCYLSWEQEQRLIESFKEKSAKGILLPPKKSSLPTSRKLDIKYIKPIYRLLERHEWHKIVPRPKHPKEDSQAQEEFKKLCSACRTN